ncbi:MAG: aspartate carbamoyltransferase regulatory subunit [Ruminococcaceae bacterium]|nr:aspartate carbamoyltransferase regulatory subunit [Oscillospiraceae bacterium]
MNIDGITQGIVLDHIAAGRSMEIYHLLHLDQLDCCVAIIKNVRSSKMGRKDIIKIDQNIEINLDVLGYIDPNITVNVIENGTLVGKKKLTLPTSLTNVISCSNPRCITTTEQECDQIFHLADPETGLYRCAYCDTAYKGHKKS